MELSMDPKLMWNYLMHLAENFSAELFSWISNFLFGLIFNTEPMLLSMKKRRKRRKERKERAKERKKRKFIWLPNKYSRERRKVKPRKLKKVIKKQKRRKKKLRKQRLRKRNNKRKRRRKKKRRRKLPKRNRKSLNRHLKRWKQVLFYLFRIFNYKTFEKWICQTSHGSQSCIRISLEIHRHFMRTHRWKMGFLALPKTTSTDPNEPWLQLIHRASLQYPPPQGIRS